MAVFRFRLDKVLRYRRRVVEQRSRAVSAAEMALAEVVGRMNVLRDRLETVADPTRPGAPVDVRGRLELAVWYDRQEKLLARLETDRRAAANELESRRADLARAWRDREVLERLRQRRQAEWRTEQERRERRELDEIGQQRAGRTRTAIAAAAAQVAP